MYISLKNILTIIFLSLFSIIEAQIYAPTANKASRTIYKNISNKYDSIFIFSLENEEKSIVAHLPDSSTATFEWSYFHPGTGYEIIDTKTTEVWAIDTITSSGGYKIKINNTDSFHCWVYVHDFSVEITSTINDTIPKGDINCRSITFIKAELKSTNLTYSDPYSSAQYTYKNQYSKTWGSNQPGATPPGPDGSLQVSVEDPYWEDTWYNITVTSKDTRQERKDSAFYKSVRPHAEFEKPKAIQLDDSVYYPDRDEKYYDYYDSATYGYTSAPALFMFKNKSENADGYTWIFGDSTVINSDTGTVFHTYELPGSYYAYLIAKKEVDFLYDPCYDTFPDAEVEINLIKVAETLDSVYAPNVFTPPNGKYKFWRFTDDVSITDFEIAIYNRYGKRVYHYKGDIRDWMGWDGSNKDKKFVSTGVYFFVVKAMRTLADHETLKLPEKLYLIKRGYIHVYNTENYN